MYVLLLITWLICRRETWNITIIQHGLHLNILDDKTTFHFSPLHYFCGAFFFFFFKEGGCSGVFKVTSSQILISYLLAFNCTLSFQRSVLQKSTPSILHTHKKDWMLKKILTHKYSHFKFHTTTSLFFLPTALSPRFGTVHSQQCPPQTALVAGRLGAKDPNRAQDHGELPPRQPPCSLPSFGHRRPSHFAENSLKFAVRSREAARPPRSSPQSQPLSGRCRVRAPQPVPPRFRPGAARSPTCCTEPQQHPHRDSPPDRCGNKLSVLGSPLIHKGSRGQARQVESTLLPAEAGSLLRNERIPRCGSLHIYPSDRYRSSSSSSSAAAERKQPIATEASLPAAPSHRNTRTALEIVWVGKSSFNPLLGSHPALLELHGSFQFLFALRKAQTDHNISSLDSGKLVYVQWENQKTLNCNQLTKKMIHLPPTRYKIRQNKKKDIPRKVH